MLIEWNQFYWMLMHWNQFYWMLMPILLDADAILLNADTLEPIWIGLSLIQTLGPVRVP